MGILVVEIQL